MQEDSKILDVQIAVGMNELEEESPSSKDKTDKLVEVAAMVAGSSGGVASPGLADQRWLQGHRPNRGGLSGSEAPAVGQCLRIGQCQLPTH